MNKTLTDQQIIDTFEGEIKNDPDAYTRPDETVYQITAKELVRGARALLAALQPEPRDEVMEFVEELRKRGAEVSPLGSGDGRLCIVGSILIDDVVSAIAASTGEGQ